jgi:uncharacterized cupredoxin-like copper-binding protein
MRKIFTAALFACTAVAGTAYAHGDEHAEKKAFDPAAVEQKDFGKAGDPAKATRTIKISMTDNMRFTPSVIDVKQGETVKFVIANDGRILHEMVIGTQDELKKHAEMMRKFPGMEHDEPHMAHVAAGKSGELVWTFNRPGQFDFACLIAGHFEAGMVGKINVAAAGSPTAK